MILVAPSQLDRAMDVYIGTYRIDQFTLLHLRKQIKLKAPAMDTRGVRTMTQALVILAGLDSARDRAITGG